MTTTAIPTAAITASGQPVWVTVTDNGDGSAAITGTPPVGTAGHDYVFGITAGNGVDPAAQQLFTLHVQAAPLAGDVVVSEFRFAGPGGADDAYVELANTTDHAVSLQGWTMLYMPGGGASPGVVGPLGDVSVPVGGHYLIAPTSSSVGGAAVDLVAPIGDRIGVQVVGPVGNVIDAAGFTTAAAVFREGTGLTAPTSPASPHAFVRKVKGTGPVDSGNNTADFTLVAADAASNPGAVLGSPSPENLASPTRYNSVARSSLVDPTKAASQAPNRVVDGGAHTLTVRRRITNTSTTARITALDVKITDLSTVGVAGTHAVLRWIDASDVTINGETVHGLTGVTPPALPDGGGTGTIAHVPLPPGGLAPGQSVAVAFTFAIDSGGRFWFRYNTLATGTSTS